jgi:hypothetical protein
VTETVRPGQDPEAGEAVKVFTAIERVTGGEVLDDERGDFVRLWNLPGRSTKQHYKLSAF